MRDYELMYIVRPDLDEEGVADSVASVKTLVAGQGGEVVKSTMWGKRRLAYEVKHLRDGHYVLANIRLEPTSVSGLERALGIHDTVFRHLLVSGDAVEPDVEDEATSAEPQAASADIAPAVIEATYAPVATDDEDDNEEQDDEITAVAAGVDEEDN